MPENKVLKAMSDRELQRRVKALGSVPPHRRTPEEKAEAIAELQAIVAEQWRRACESMRKRVSE